MSSPPPAQAEPNIAADEVAYTAHELKRETGWLGAFVIGLAGTILVTGIAPTMVTTLGAASIPVTVFITLTGWLLCLFLAELAAMMPDRTGGAPSYAYPAFRDRWPGLAKHINGMTAWMYWLGWFPVAPLNMILASFYLADRFGLNTKAGFTPVHTFIAWSTLAISIIGILGFFIPAWKGIRFGAGFATILAVLSMIPLTFIAVAWLFVPSAVNWHELAGFPHLDGSGFFAGMSGTGWHYGWLTIYIAYAFLLTWNVIAMEAAACYIGECANPERDAKIALNLEGGYGVFIYTLIPVAS
jgi:amino acid transporter